MSTPVEKEAGSIEPAKDTSQPPAPEEPRKREYKDFGHEEAKATRMLLLLLQSGFEFLTSVFRRQG